MTHYQTTGGPAIQFTSAKFKIKVLIVEEDILNAQKIAIQLSKHFNVVGITHGLNDALKWLQQNSRVDIILSDMLNEREDGIALGKIIHKTYHIPFVLLYSESKKEQLHRAKTASPAWFIAKPFDENELPIAIELALANFSKKASSSNSSNKTGLQSGTMNISDRLFLKKDHHFQRVALKDISLLEADGNYTTIYAQKDKFIYSTQLKYMEEKLPTDRFIRVHRSHVINIDAVDGWEGNTLFVQNKRIMVSKQYREKVFSIFSPF